jgi:hypothetical protein
MDKVKLPNGTAIMVSLKEQLNAFSAVNAPADLTAIHLETTLKRFGPVTRSAFETFRDAVAYLLPIKSFTTRYLILGLDGWSLIVNDMRGEISYVEAYAISRIAGYKAIGVVLNEQRRELHIFEGGKKLRQVQSEPDGDRWYFREEGKLQPFEDAEEYTRRPKHDRLRLSAVVKYFKNYTGFDVPDWGRTKFTKFWGLERSTKDLLVPVKEFDTRFDLG